MHTGLWRLECSSGVFALAGFLHWLGAALVQGLGNNYSVVGKAEKPCEICCHLTHFQRIFCSHFFQVQSPHESEITADTRKDFSILAVHSVKLNFWIVLNRRIAFLVYESLPSFTPLLELGTFLHYTDTCTPARQFGFPEVSTWVRLVVV